MEGVSPVDDDAGRLNDEPLRVIDPGVEGVNIEVARVEREIPHVVISDVVGGDLDREGVFVGVMEARNLADHTPGELELDVGRRDVVGGGRERGHDGESGFH